MKIQFSDFLKTEEKKSPSHNPKPNQKNPKPNKTKKLCCPFLLIDRVIVVPIYYSWKDTNSLLEINYGFPRSENFTSGRLIWIMNGCKLVCSSRDELKVLSTRYFGILTWTHLSPRDYIMMVKCHFPILELSGDSTEKNILEMISDFIL